MWSMKSKNAPLCHQCVQKPHPFHSLLGECNYLSTQVQIGLISRHLTSSAVTSLPPSLFTNQFKAGVGEWRLLYLAFSTSSSVLEEMYKSVAVKYNHLYYQNRGQYLPFSKWHKKCFLPEAVLISSLIVIYIVLLAHISDREVEHFLQYCQVVLKPVTCS